MRWLFTAALSLSTSVVMAQATPPAGSHVIVAQPEKITWSPAPNALPSGAKLAVLEGNPFEAGPYTMRLQMPGGYRIPPHSHPGVEHVTVVKGTFKVGMGEKFDPAAMMTLPNGTFAALDPGVHHYAEAQGETVIQLHGIGPWAINYVNPKDDPRKPSP
jgi:mannose-6-phosphate isomerase-like protein (cupin superfamily)